MPISLNQGGVVPRHRYGACHVRMPAARHSRVPGLEINEDVRWGGADGGLTASRVLSKGRESRKSERSLEVSAQPRKPSVCADSTCSTDEMPEAEKICQRIHSSADPHVARMEYAKSPTDKGCGARMNELDVRTSHQRQRAGGECRPPCGEDAIRRKPGRQGLRREDEQA
ncbi:hypothetical protein BKA81DRAFT_378200 [Phyllosticta paracitricarpa]